MNARPLIGVETLLVYRECFCGNWCATGEGATAPICSECGGRMLPGTAPDAVDPREYRRVHGLGFRAKLANEIALASGVDVESAVQRAADRYGDFSRRYYDPGVVGPWSEAIEDASPAPDGPPDMGGTSA